MTSDNNATITVEIPADVRDNSEAVTDYAFMRHRSPDRGIIEPRRRDVDLRAVREYLSSMYDIYTWPDVNPDGQRCRFDLVVNKKSGVVSDLFHTEYFTRVACGRGDWCHSYASAYVAVSFDNGEPDDGPTPLCDEHTREIRRAYGEGATIRTSEPLLTGQHD
jgi:hypothetical protein